LNDARIEISNPLSDLASPGLFGVLIDLGVEAVDERVGQCCPGCRRQNFKAWVNNSAASSAMSPF